MKNKIDNLIWKCRSKHDFAWAIIDYFRFYHPKIYNSKWSKLFDLLWELPTWDYTSKYMKWRFNHD